MKKIVGILAAAGVMAASIFAADVSAKVKVDGNLFNYDGDGGISVLTIQHNSEAHNPDLSVSVSADNAGASMSFYNSGADGNIGAIKGQKYSVWFKPIDMLKVTVGHYGTNLNQETIEYWRSQSGHESHGYALDLDVSGFFATLFFAPDWGNSWLSKAKDKDVELKNLYFKAGYGADFGRIQAMFYLVDTKNMKFGVAYNNTFGSVNMFVNALAALNTDKGFGIRGEAFASTNIDIVGLSLFVNGGYAADAEFFGISADKASLGAVFKATFALNGFTPYICIIGDNFLADTFGMTVKPGVTGNVGLMAWEVFVKMDIVDKFTVDVPVSFSVSF